MAPRSTTALAQHDVVGYSLLAMGDQWQFTGPEGPVSVKVRPRLWTNNGDTCIAAAVRGAGILARGVHGVDAQLDDRYCPRTSTSWPSANSRAAGNVG